MMLVSATAPAKLTLDQALHILATVHTDDGAGGFYVLTSTGPTRDVSEEYMAAWGRVRDHLGLL